MRLAVWTLVLVAGCGSFHPMTMTSDAAPTDAKTVPRHVVAYVSGYGPSIAWLDFDTMTGALSPAGTIAAAQPSFLALTTTHVYAVSENRDRVLAFAADATTGALVAIDDQASGGSGPAHVSVDRSGAFVLAANYGGGTIAVLPITANGGLAAATQTLSAGINAHMIITDPANHFAFVPCRGSDYIAQYAFDAATGQLAPNAVPRVTTAAGAGPRHLAFAPDGQHAYLISENASTLTAFAYDGSTGHLAELQTTSTRAAGASGTSTGAEVAVHPGGRFVYGSNRGDDDIAMFAVGADGKVTLVANTSTGGMTPRGFAIDPTGKWLLAANQGSNSVVTFAIDPATGTLARTGSPLTATMPAFVGFLALP
jgi:6-phosphogluconolactonase